MNHLHECACGCGCGCTGHRPDMQYVQRLWVSGKTVRPGRCRQLVLSKHAADYEAELAAGMLLEDLVSSNLEAWPWQRIRVAPRIFRATIEVHARNKGPTVARRMAWQAVRLFVMPQWNWLRGIVAPAANVSVEQPALNQTP